MQVVREMSLAHPKGLRKTLVRGIDDRHYTIYTFRLYDRDPAPEFANFEVNVIQTDDHGDYQLLNQPFFQRFYSREEALARHEDLLESLDKTLQLQAPQPKKSH